MPVCRDHVASIEVGYWSGTESAVADDFGCDALTDLALGGGIDQKREIGVAVGVDKAGAHDQAVEVHYSGGLPVGNLADGGDPGSVDSHRA